MGNKVEESVKRFYNTAGWMGKSEVEGKLFRQFSPGADRHHKRVNARLEALFEDGGEALLIAGGGDMPGSHVRISKRFQATTCLDISSRAIEVTREKLGADAHCVVGSILESGLPDNHFDSALCAHVIYHIDKDQQEKAVRELVRVVKPGGMVVVIYSNPHSLFSKLIGWSKKLFRKSDSGYRKKELQDILDEEPLYFFHHELSWWSRFSDSADVELSAWNAMASEQDAYLFTRGWASHMGYGVIEFLHANFPRFAARHWGYPIFVLKKR